MPLALQKSTDGGTTFTQVQLDVADYTLSDGRIANVFYSIKDSQNNTYIQTAHSTFSSGSKGSIIKINKDGEIVGKSLLNYTHSANISGNLILSRDEKTIYTKTDTASQYAIPIISVSNIDNSIASTNLFFSTIDYSFKFAIYKDRYIWVASGDTVEIYNYDTKVKLASATGASLGYLAAIYAISCNSDNELFISGATSAAMPGAMTLIKLSFNGVSTLTPSVYSNIIASQYSKQLLIDRFGDLNILTNTGTASTLLKYSTAGTLIDTVSLSVGTNKGAYGLQVYSSDNGTKCWVQFSNDLGTWKTAFTTAQGQIFGAVNKIRDNGVTTYGDDHGGDNNYSVRC